MNVSGIEWCTHTWTPVKGCSHVGQGCDYCYAETTAQDKRNNPIMDKYVYGFRLEQHYDAAITPLLQKSECLVFLTSMGDVFHTEPQKGYFSGKPGGRVDGNYLDFLFDVMNVADHCVFQILTKRPNRVPERLKFGQHMWIGTSVESPLYYHRIDSLRKVKADVRFLSLEPALTHYGRPEHHDYARLEQNLAGISWIILGGESYADTPETEYKEYKRLKKKGMPEFMERRYRKVSFNSVDDVIAHRKKREMSIETALRVRDICAKKDIKFFFKQYGHHGKKPHRLLPALTPNQYRDVLKRKGLLEADRNTIIDYIGNHPRLFKAREYNELPEPGEKIREAWKAKSARAG